MVSPIYVAMSLEGKVVSYRANHVWTCSLCPAQSLLPVSQEKGVMFCHLSAQRGCLFAIVIILNLLVIDLPRRKTVTKIVFYQITFLTQGRHRIHSLLILDRHSLPSSIILLCVCDQG